MNPMNPMKLLQIKASWEQFKARHPKFPSFLNAVSKGAVTEGALIEMTITTADGKELTVIEKGPAYFKRYAGPFCPVLSSRHNMDWKSSVITACVIAC